MIDGQLRLMHIRIYLTRIFGIKDDINQSKHELVAKLLYIQKKKSFIDIH